MSRDQRLKVVSLLFGQTEPLRLDIVGGEEREDVKGDRRQAWLVADCGLIFRRGWLLFRRGARSKN